MTHSLTIDLPLGVREDDVKKMIAALASFRGEQWWFRAENVVGGGRSLSPLVLQNMLLQFECGTLEPSMHKFRNLLETAIYYEAKARELQGQLDEEAVPGGTANRDISGRQQN